MTTINQVLETARDALMHCRKSAAARGYDMIENSSGQNYWYRLRDEADAALTRIEQALAGVAQGAGQQAEAVPLYAGPAGAIAQPVQPAAPLTDEREIAIRECVDVLCDVAGNCGYAAEAATRALARLGVTWDGNIGWVCALAPPQPTTTNAATRPK